MVTWKNVSPHFLKIDAKYLDDSVWEGTTGPRPAKVKIPPGAVIAIADEWSCRRLAAPSSAPVDGEPLPSRPASIQEAAPQLVPHGEAAEKFYATVMHHQLPQTIRALAEIAAATRAEAHERWQLASETEARVASAVKETLAKLYPESKPAEAEPRFVVEP